MKKHPRTLGLWVFFQELLKNPSAMGAVFPSSIKLAESLAEQVPKSDTGLVIELGAGTGVVTQALLNHGIPPHRLIVIERSAKFVEHLRARFPELRIIEGDAANLSELLRPYAQEVGCVVSSLPFRSLPAHTVAVIGQELDKVLKPNGLLVEFTYNFRKKLPFFSNHLKQIYSKWIWLNAPPALIEVFRHTISRP